MHAPIDMLTPIHVCMCMHAHMCMKSHLLTLTHAHTHTRMHACTHARTHACTHMHTHTHTHTHKQKSRKKALKHWLISVIHSVSDASPTSLPKVSHCSHDVWNIKETFWGWSWSLPCPKEGGDGGFTRVSLCHTASDLGNCALGICFKESSHHKTGFHLTSSFKQSKYKLKTKGFVLKVPCCSYVNFRNGYPELCHV